LYKLAYSRFPDAAEGGERDRENRVETNRQGVSESKADRSSTTMMLKAREMVEDAETYGTRKEGEHTGD